MPVYLAHGFRWPRNGFTGIRVHIIVHNLEDVSVEYIQNELSSETLRQNFRQLHPAIMKQLEDTRTGRTIHFLEQYDPQDDFGESVVSQNYAFVADRVVMIAAGNQGGEQKKDIPQTSRSPPSTSHSRDASSSTSAASQQHLSSSSASSNLPARHNTAALSLNVDEAMSSGSAITPQAWEALAELRDKIAEGEKIGWWVIYNGDPDRAFEDDEEEDKGDDTKENDQVYELEEEGSRTPTQIEQQGNGILGQPLPSMLPAGMRARPVKYTAEEQIGTAIPHPPPVPEKPKTASDDPTASRPKSSRAFVNPLSLRKKSSKANLQPRKDEEIPDPPKLKEINKKDGFRHKFFGRGEKK